MTTDQKTPMPTIKIQSPFDPRDPQDAAERATFIAEYVVTDEAGWPYPNTPVVLRETSEGVVQLGIMGDLARSGQQPSQAQMQALAKAANHNARLTGTLADVIASSVLVPVLRAGVAALRAAGTPLPDGYDRMLALMTALMDEDYSADDCLAILRGMVEGDAATGVAPLPPREWFGIGALVHGAAHLIGLLPETVGDAHKAATAEGVARNDPAWVALEHVSQDAVTEHKTKLEGEALREAVAEGMRAWQGRPVPGLS